MYCAGLLDACEEDNVEENQLSTELLADTVDVLNAVGDGEDADKYGAMDSGDDSQKDDLEVEENDDDCYAGSRYESEEEDAEPTESAIAADVMFAETFLSIFGGEDAVLAGNIKTDVLRETSESGWEDVDEPDTCD
ncbi:unnamed protein product [Phytophthora fragariaefolia]|uniref:Unnamed protein product n=1 Tax=Phytophthora fragariaefolia TaxID=1490495 RepID=A0A9W7D0V6_9STRA|nr:unnamed protein product [Phytophthora fragariaefolia]